MVVVARVSELMPPPPSPDREYCSLVLISEEIAPRVVLRLEIV
jgi:hypothetical protein